MRGIGEWKSCSRLTGERSGRYPTPGIRHATLFHGYLRHNEIEKQNFLLLSFSPVELGCLIVSTTPAFIWIVSLRALFWELQLQSMLLSVLQLQERR